uniref:Sulfotransferase family protein n=1 Tax=viral metagenome TaxID=1070528 RepID=A0A6C0LLD8_9ZZZZ
MLIISHKYKIIFFHNFKTGGTYITRLLKKLDPNVDTVSNGINPHSKAIDVKFKIPLDIWDNYAKFCFVRNSWDWQISFYFYIRSHPSNPQYNMVITKNFSEYLTWIKETGQYETQLSFIVDNNRDMNCLVDNILKFENFRDELIWFFKNKCNTDISPFLIKRKINASVRDSNYRIYYNEDDQNKIAEMHKSDIEYFKFQF